MQPTSIDGTGDKRIQIRWSWVILLFAVLLCVLFALESCFEFLRDSPFRLRHVLKETVTTSVSITAGITTAAFLLNARRPRGKTAGGIG